MTQGKVWLPRIKHTPSPNCDARPDLQDISLLVIHNISLPPDEFGSDDIEAFFQNRLDAQAHPYFAQIADMRVSAHLLIRRDGQAQQFVALDQRAWHAGVSCFANRENCNDFSIGIELEGSDHIAFENAQYNTLVKLTRQIQALYPAITQQRIVGHSHIALGRKTDPGPYFDWPHYFSLLSQTARTN
jgi:AmpD protein